jgi:hypothetical protein
MDDNILISNTINNNILGADVIAIGGRQNYNNNIIIGYQSEINSYDSDNNIIIGTNNNVDGNNNMIIGHNNIVKGSNNVIFSSNQTIICDNYYIVPLTRAHKNMSIMFDDILIYKLLIFKHFIEIMLMPDDIVKSVVYYVYDLRLTKGEAMGYCVNTIKQALGYRYQY